MPNMVKVEALCVKDRKSRYPNASLLSADVTLEGFVGDIHSGFTRLSDARDEGITRGTVVRNWRQWSAVSSEELKLIADKMSLSRLDPWLLAANVALSGAPSLTALPRGTNLIFEGGVILTVEGENAPCTGPGKEIAALHTSKTPAEFVKAAMHRRGLVGVVYRAGVIRLGEALTIQLPK